MFCVRRPARILRLYGRGRVIEPGDADWSAVEAGFPTCPGPGRDRPGRGPDCRLVRLRRPRYEYVGERPQLIDWADRQGPDGLHEYKSRKNRSSIDGLPGLPSVAGPTERPRFERLGVPGMFAVCRLPSDDPVPTWATWATRATGGLFSVTRTADELSVVCPQAAVPADVRCERGWRCLRVAGTIPFAQVGVLASLTTAVARAGAGVFAVSTFDTDYLFVQETDLPRAIAGLTADGHLVEAGPHE